MEPRPLPSRKLFLTPAEAAPLLGMSADLVREGIRRGEIPGRKVMGRYKVLAEALSEIVPRTVAPAPAPRRPWS